MRWIAEDEFVALRVAVRNLSVAPQLQQSGQPVLDARLDITRHCKSSRGVVIAHFEPTTPKR